MDWNYILSGTGTETFLIVSGIFGMADTGYRMVMNFEKTYRVLSLSYPSYLEMGALVERDRSKSDGSIGLDVNNVILLEL